MWRVSIRLLYQSLDYTYILKLFIEIDDIDCLGFRVTEDHYLQTKSENSTSHISSKGFTESKFVMFDSRCWMETSSSIHTPINISPKYRSSFLP